MRKTKLVYRSALIGEVLRQIHDLAPTPITIVILGETGVGKEMIARYIHDCSDRADKKYMTLNCGGLLTDAAQAELFGSVPGAYTGVLSKVKPGIFEEVEGGTVFLDEIGELAPSLQAALLRVIQEHAVRRTGSAAEIPVDFRLICATNQDLVTHPTFRSDFLYRISGCKIVVPPLRQHLEDIDVLVPHFIDEYKEKCGKTGTLTSEAFQALRSYGWPGNVRELKAVVELTLAVYKGSGDIGPDDIRFPLAGVGSAPSGFLADLTRWELRLFYRLTEDERRRYEALRRHGFIESEAAKSLGVTRGALNNYLLDPIHANLKQLCDEGRKGIWTKKLEDEIKKLGRSDRFLGELVNKSRPSSHDVPFVIPRVQLEQKELTQWLPHAAYRILLVFPRHGQDTVTITRKKVAGEMCCVLQVDLTDQTIGIYNNDGKKFLRKEFMLADKATRDLLYRASAQVHKLLMERPHSDEEQTFSWKQLAGRLNVPFRWTSGGILAIAEYKGKEWVVLFFRDIPPVGWNVGNGAAGIAKELTDLEFLIGREFAEELMLLNQVPRPGPLGAMQFAFKDPYRYALLNPDRHDAHQLTEFMQVHQILRSEHDQIKIEINADESEQREAKRIYSVKHYPIVVRDGGERFNTGGVIWSLNPLECGIEAIRLYRFKMTEPEWLVDGEIFPAPWSPAKWLIRRPVILLNLEFLREQFANRGNSFGDVLDEAGSEECKRLDGSPKEGEDFILFVDFDGNDIDLREHRLGKIAEEFADNALRLTEAEVDRDRVDEVEELRRTQEALESERAQIHSWLEGYRQPFNEAHVSGRLESERLRTLCPVTWKTLELAFQNKYL